MRQILISKAEDIENKFLKANPKIDRKKLNWRLDGRLEWLDDIGVGHTVFAPDGSDYNHGCNGLCRNVKMPRWTKAERLFKRFKDERFIIG